MIQVAHRFRLPTSEQAGLGARHLGLVSLALAIGSATLTFDRIIEHRPELNYVGEFAGAVLYPSDLFLVLGLAIWTVGWWLSPRLQLRGGSWYVFLPLLILVTLTMLSVLWADYGTQAGFAALRRLLIFGLYIVMVSDCSRAVPSVVAVLFSFALLHAVVAVVQVALGSPLGLTELGEMSESGLFIGGQIGAPRAYGLGFNPNPVGLFLAVVSALAYGLLLNGLLLAGRSSWVVRTLTLGTFIVSSLGLVSTMSRSAMLGWSLALVAVSLLAWTARKYPLGISLKRIRVPVLLVVLALGIFFTYTYLPGTRDRLGGPPQSREVIDAVAQRLELDAISRGLSSRVEDWKLSFPIVEENLLLGVGAGNYPVALKERLSPGAFGSVFVPVHNVFLLILAELGVIGAGAWALVMGAPFIWVLRGRRVHPDKPNPILWLGPLLVLLVVSLLEFGPWATQDARLLFPSVLGLWAGAVVAQEPAQEGGR